MTEQVDQLAAIIRHVDGGNRLGAAALAEAILSHPDIGLVLANSDGPDWPARLRNCPTHGQQPPQAWGCPECVRQLREELAAARLHQPTPPAEGEEPMGNEPPIQPTGRSGLTWKAAIDGLRDVLADQTEDAIRSVWQRFRILDAIDLMAANHPAFSAGGAAGEIADHILAELQGFHLRHRVFGELTVARLTSAAELLQQQEAEINRLRAQQAPVPVIERLPGLEDLSPKVKYCWWWNCMLDSWAFCDAGHCDHSVYTHWLPAHALPQPQGGG